MKRILCWIGTIGAFFLLSGCVEGMNGLDLEGGSEAGNPPAGDRPAAPPDSNPDGERDKDHCEEGEEPVDCLDEAPQRKGGITLYVPPKEAIDKVAPTDIEAEATEEPAEATGEPLIKIRPEALEHFRDLLEEDESDE